jgi:hypothetical protein
MGFRDVPIDPRDISSIHALHLSMLSPRYALFHAMLRYKPALQPFRNGHDLVLLHIPPPIIEILYLSGIAELVPLLFR